MHKEGTFAFCVMMAPRHKCCIQWGRAVGFGYKSVYHGHISITALGITYGYGSMDYPLALPRLRCLKTGWKQLNYWCPLMSVAIQSRCLFSHPPWKDTAGNDIIAGMDIYSSAMWSLQQWQCGSVAVWQCGSVAVWQCGSVAVWQCGSVAVWQCGSVAVWQCGRVAVWQCGSVAVWQCGSVAVWQCGSVAVWQCGSVAPDVVA